MMAMPHDPNKIDSLILPSFSEISQCEMDVGRLELDRQKHEIEKIKLIYTGAIERWKDRRANEWKLNYAIWVAIAAFDGLLLTKGIAAKLPPVSVWWTVIIGVGLHAAYLYPTSERGICEINLLLDLERSMVRLISDQKLREGINERHIGGGVHRLERWGKFPDWLWRHYGLVAPLAFTATLLSIAGYLMSGRS